MTLFYRALEKRAGCSDALTDQVIVVLERTVALLMAMSYENGRDLLRAQLLNDAAVDISVGEDLKVFPRPPTKVQEDDDINVLLCSGMKLD
ncbi:unnamed protein product [Gongylonema pulchrum]|uniref:Inositol monophosphatase n=1 Tax=Gongylonema pulchrum TaxID=637853 RepID=A0A183DAI5_9BILA|nr:unnamed protein product [Gongylonema pulchrum]